MGVLSSDEYQKWGRSTDAAHLMAKLIRKCILNPDVVNQRILTEPAHQKRSPFSEFLTNATVAFAHIHLRNTGAQSDITVISNHMAWRIMYPPSPQGPSALTLAMQGLGFGTSAAHTTQPEPFIDAATLVRVIEAFAINSYNKEKPEHIGALADAWEAFISSGSAFANECARKGDGSFMLDLAATPHELWTTALNIPATAADIQDVLDIQQDYAEAHGAINYSETRRIIGTVLSTYDGLMRPEIMVHRSHDSTAVTSRRWEFDRLVRKAWLMSTAASLRTYNDTVDEALRIPDELLMRMQRGILNAEKTQDGVVDREHLSIEHTTPLSGSDNFAANFSIMPKLMNGDMHFLIAHQTDGTKLNRDMLGGNKGSDFEMDVTGDTLPVIIMRPRKDPETGLTIPILTIPEDIRNNLLLPNRKPARQPFGYFTVREGVDQPSLPEMTGRMRFLRQKNL